MNKKAIRLVMMMLAVLMFSGCTLFLDEVYVPEEERGVGEPYSDKTDIIDITYEFNEGVRPITSNVMNYFIRCEADTILYFLDNVPAGWLPEVGGYVQIGINESFPLGYIGKVLQKTREDGCIRLVTTYASVHEVFKTLEYTSEGPLTLSSIPDDYEYEYEEVIDSSQTDTLTGEYKIDVIPTKLTNFVDYTKIKEYVPALYAKQLTRCSSMTRSSDDNVNEDKEEVEEWNWHFSLSAPDGVATYKGSNVKFPEIVQKKIEEYNKKLKKKFSRFIELSSGGNDLDPFFHYNSKTTRTYRIVYSKAQNKQSTDIIEDKEQTYTFGVSFDRSVSAGAKKHLIDSYRTDAPVALDLIRFPFTVPIYQPIGLALVLDFNLGVKFAMSCVGTVTYTSNSHTVVNGSQEGEKEASASKPETKVERPSTSKIDFDITGGGLLGGYAGLGLEVGIGAKGMKNIEEEDGIKRRTNGGIGVDVTFTGGIKVNATTNNNIGDSNDEFFCDDNYFKPFLTYEGYVYAHASPFGFNLKALKVDLPKSGYDFVNFKWYFDPELEGKSFVVEYHDSQNTYPVVRGSYSFSSTGIYHTSNYKPVLRIYRWPYSRIFRYETNKDFFADPKNLVGEAPALGGVGKFASNELYNFEVSTPLEFTDGSLLAVPAIKTGSGNYIVYDSYAHQIEVGKPTMGIKDVVCTKARKCVDADRNKYGLRADKTKPNYFGNYWLVEYVVVTDIQYGTKVSAVNLDMSVRNKPGEFDFTDEYFSENAKRTITRDFTTGRYLFTYSFVTTRDISSDDLEISLDASFVDVGGKNSTVASFNKLFHHSSDFPIKDRKCGFDGKTVNIK